MHPMPVAKTDPFDTNSGVIVFEQILQQMRPLLLKYAIKQGVALSACDDVVQDTLLIAWRNLRQLRDQTKLRSWMYGICQNVCRHHLRQRRGEEARTLPLDQEGDDTNTDAHLTIASDTFDPAEWLDQPDWEGLLDRALAYLPSGARDIVILADLQALPHREAATQLGVTLSAFAARLHRARQQLRDVLRTALRDDTINLGIFLDGELPAEWRATRTWCFFCGRHRLAGGFFPVPEAAGLIDFRLRCPDCGTMVTSGGSVPLQGIQAFKPAMKRLWNHLNRFFPSTISQGDLGRCNICGTMAWVGFRHRDDLRMPIALVGDYWLVYDCPRCGESVTSPLMGCPDQSSYQDFLKRYPRGVLEPPQFITWKGMPAISNHLVNRIGSEQLTVIISIQQPELFAVFAG